MKRQFHTPEGIVERELTDQEVIEWANYGDAQAKIEMYERGLALPMCEHYAQITAINPNIERPINAIITYKGKQFPQQCYVTQDLVDAYLAGKLKVGNYIIIQFLENAFDKPIATQKVYKTW